MRAHTHAQYMYTPSSLFFYFVVSKCNKLKLMYQEEAYKRVYMQANVVKLAMYAGAGGGEYFFLCTVVRALYYCEHWFS